MKPGAPHVALSTTIKANKIYYNSTLSDAAAAETTVYAAGIIYTRSFATYETILCKKMKKKESHPNKGFIFTALITT